MEDEFVWQCKCGHIEHGGLPEDCSKCLRVGKFTRLPEDMVQEKIEEAVLSMKEGYEDEEGFEE